MKNNFLKKSDKYCKKAIAAVLSSAVILSSASALAAPSFSDLSGHWGESFINVLIGDGTISGYEDGTFRPDATVTRAEFVKMIGKSEERFSTDFKDVPTDHWGYEYIMYSQLAGNGDYFEPDVAITRNDVINLIWKRNGSVDGIKAPFAITRQGTNKAAVAWGYESGLVIGDDGFNLRLKDTLTRAEASALIVRARNIDKNAKAKDFVDTVSDGILKSLYNQLNLFDTPYSPDETITNGEMARAVLRYSARSKNLNNLYPYAKTLFDGEYAKDLYLIGKECIGLDKVTESFCNEEANVSNTLAELCYNSRKLVTKSFVLPTETTSYSDVKDVSDKVKKQLDFASSCGIYLYGTDEIKPDEKITKKQFMALVLQLDELIGSQLIYNSSTPSNASVSKQIDKYPSNYEDYSCILKDVPSFVYEKKLGDTKAKESTGIAANLASSFRDMLNEVEQSASSNGFVIKTSYYPTLVSTMGNGTVIRVKIEFSKVSPDKKVSDFINIASDVTLKPQSGDVCYVDIQIPPMLDLYISPDDVKIIDVIK